MSIRMVVDLDRACRVLNELAKADPMAMTCLVEGRVPFNVGTMQAVPGVQGRVADTEDGHPAEFIGLVGVVNALFGADENGNGPIAAVQYHDEPDPLHPMFVVARRPK